MRGPTNYANPGKRLLAYIIDGLILSVPLSIIGVIVILPTILGVISQVDNLDNGGELNPMVIGGFIGAYLIFLFLAILIQFLYFTLMESSKRQATLGKMAMSIYVTDEAGQRMTFGKAAIRYIGRIVNGLTMGIGYLVILFTQNKQGLHDIIAKTLVLDGNRSQEGTEDEFQAL